jgi:hypothetical protein
VTSLRNLCQYFGLTTFLTKMHCDKQNSRSVILKILVGGLLSLSLAAGTDPVTPELPGDVTINPNAGRGNFLFVTVRLADGESLPFIVDTGASSTIFAKSLEPKLGKRLGTDVARAYGNNEAGNYAAPKIYLDGVALITDSNVSTLDLKLLEQDADRHIMGIIGFDCLSNYCIQLDFDAGKMRFLDSRHLDTNKLGKAFPITIGGDDRLPYIHHVGLAGGSVTNCQIDTGTSYDGWVDKSAFAGNHLPESHWDGGTYTNLNVSFGPADNVLGLAFLARHLVTFDFRNHMLYLKQTSVGPLNLANKSQK